jgi:hypothetical protein
MADIEEKARWDEYFLITLFIIGTLGALWLCFREEKVWNYLTSSFLSIFTGNF